MSRKGCIDRKRIERINKRMSEKKKKNLQVWK